MPYEHLSRLLEIKYVQDLTQQKIDEHIFITYKKIWEILCNEKKFFRSYRTYLKYISEPGINERIKKLQL